MNKFKINIDSGAKIQKFVDILTEKNIEAVLESKNGAYRVYAKSILGALATLDWTEVWIVSENDIYSAIKDFIVE